MVFLVVDEDGNELIVKVDRWVNGITDPTAPEAQYAAVEAFLASQGINATVVDHAIKAGSYQGNSGGGIFLSDGSRVPQSDIEDYWFGEAWGGKSFNGPNVDFELEFDDLPEVESSGADSAQAKALNEGDESGEQESDNLSDELADGVELTDDAAANVIVDSDANEGLSLLDDTSMESLDLLFDDDLDSTEILREDGNAKTQVVLDFNDGNGETSGEILDAIEAGDLISEDGDLPGLLSDGDAPQADTSGTPGQFDSINLEENLKLDLDDGDSGEIFD